MIKNYVLNSKHQSASKWLVLFIDAFIILICFVLSYLIRFNLTLDFNVKMLLLQLPIITGIAVIAFLITGSYKSVIRHTGIRDVYNLFNAICLNSIITHFFSAWFTFFWYCK